MIKLYETIKVNPAISPLAVTVKLLCRVAVVILCNSCEYNVSVGFTPAGRQLTATSGACSLAFSVAVGSNCNGHRKPFSVR